MKKFVQNKLVRDKIPGFLEKNGSKIHIKKLSDSDYNASLFNKLAEEVEEVQKAANQNELLEEIADVLEVLDAICSLHDIDKSALEKCKQSKFEKKGGFYNRTFVTIAEHKQGSLAEKYCLDQPDKYPEIL